MARKAVVHLLLVLLYLQNFSTANCAARIDLTVLRYLETFPTVPVLVQFGAHHISRAIDEHRITRSSDLADKLTEPEVTTYIEKLKRIAREYQASVLAYLQSGSCGANYPDETCRNIEYFQLYISNEISIQNADRALINRMSNMPNVTEILLDENVVQYHCGSSPQVPATTTPEYIYIPTYGFHLDMIHVKELWDKNITGEGVVVGISDSGVSLDHRSILQNNYRGSYGWMDVSSDNWQCPFDGDFDFGHGTCTLSLAVGGPDEHGEPVGVAPGAKWMACKHSSKRSLGYKSNFRKCMQWFACPTLVNGSNPNCSMRPDVINLSFGGGPLGRLEDTYFKVLEDINLLVIQSAGNHGPQCKSLAEQANFDWPIVVGNVDHTRRIVDLSSRGPTWDDKFRPHLVAPGESVRCLRNEVKGDWFTYGYGTSSSAPLVMGIVALIKSYKPQLTAAQLKSVVIRGSWSNYSREGEDCEGHVNTLLSNPNSVYGYGIANAVEAYCLAKKNKFPSITELLGERPQIFESPCD